MDEITRKFPSSARKKAQMTQTYYLAPAFRPRCFNPRKAWTSNDNTPATAFFPPQCTSGTNPLCLAFRSLSVPAAQSKETRPVPYNALEALAKLDSASYLSQPISGPGESAIGSSGELGRKAWAGV